MSYTFCGIFSQALFDLLDQMEDAISTEGANIKRIEASLSKDEDQECSDMPRQTDLTAQLVEKPKEVNGPSLDRIFLVLEVCKAYLDSFTHVTCGMRSAITFGILIIRCIGS